MKITFEPLVPKKSQTTETLYALIFSSNITQINHKTIQDGFLKTTVAEFSKKGIWELKSARAFQGLLIIEKNHQEWVSNLYFTGKTFKQGPWISTSLKQLHEKFVIQIETDDNESPDIQIESNAPLFFKTKNRKQYEDAWIFPEKPKSIQGIIDTPKESHPILIAQNGNGYETSVNLKLNLPKTPKEPEKKRKCPKISTKKFHVTKCIQCEDNQICKIIPALEKKHPWTKFIQNA